MTDATVFIQKGKGYKGYFICSDGSPNCLGRYLLECNSDEKINSLLYEFSSDSFDCEELKSPYGSGCNYIRINGIWYYFGYNNTIFQIVEDAIKKQEKYIEAYEEEPKVRLKRNSYFEAINSDGFEGSMREGRAIAYASYTTSVEGGYKTIMTRSWIEPDEVDDFTRTMKEAEVRSFSYPFDNLEEVTPLFSKAGFIRNGLSKEKRRGGGFFYTPKFTYYPDESINE